MLSLFSFEMIEDFLFLPDVLSLFSFKKMSKDFWLSDVFESLFSYSEKMSWHEDLLRRKTKAKKE